MRGATPIVEKNVAETVAPLIGSTPASVFSVKPLAVADGQRRERP